MQNLNRGASQPRRLSGWHRRAWLLAGCVAALTLGGCHTGGTPAELAALSENYTKPPIRVSEVALGPGDTVRIDVFRHPDLNRTFTVPRQGTVSMALIGDFDVIGRRPSDLRTHVATELEQYIVSPQVSLDVTVRRSQRVMVLGEVRNPGVFTVGESPLTAVEAIAAAGGFLRSSERSQVLHHRLINGETVQTLLNIDDVLLRGALNTDNIQLEGGDVIFVPPTGFAQFDRFATHIATWLSPVLNAEEAILLGDSIKENVFDDSSSGGGGGIIVVPSAPSN